MSRKFLRARPAVQRPEWLAEVVGLELRNVVAKYPFESSHRFPGIKPNSGHRDYSRLSCGVGETQLGPSARISAGGSCENVGRGKCDQHGQVGPAVDVL